MFFIRIQLPINSIYIMNVTFQLHAFILLCVWKHFLFCWVFRLFSHSWSNRKLWEVKEFTCGEPNSTVSVNAEAWNKRLSRCFCWTLDKIVVCFPDSWKKETVMDPINTLSHDNMSNIELSFIKYSQLSSISIFLWTTIWSQGVLVLLLLNIFC